MRPAGRVIWVCALAMFAPVRTEAVKNLKLASNLSSTAQFIQDSAGTNSCLSITSTAGGKIGIGTTSVYSKLAMVDATSGSSGVSKIVDCSNGTDANVDFYVSKVGATTKYADISSYGTIALCFNTQSGGNVGIGTISPGSYKLNVNGTIRGGAMEADSITVRGTGPTIKANISTGHHDLILNDLCTIYNGGGLYETDFTGKVAADTGVFGNVRANGRVTIGTATTKGNSAYKLLVDGKVGVREVYVTSNASWSDYVFNNDYKLRSLSQVEKQIARDKHLEGIPSAKEIATTGIPVGEMQAKLLAKVEELTLYVIAQDKKIAKLADENSALKTRVASLTKK